MNLETMTPTDDLTPECIEYLASLGSKSTKLSEILTKHDDIVYNEIKSGIFLSKVF